MRLRDRVVIVTGATTGIGEAIARRCLSEGAQVLVHGLEADLAAQVVAGAGTQAEVHLDDLADPGAAQRVVDHAVDRFGRVDAICNNAAVLVRGDLAMTDAALFDRVMAVNVRAPLLLVQAAQRHLVASGGCVLNIGSVNAYCGEASLLAYSVSKGALMTLSRNLADALAEDGVRVNHLNVGWVLTANEHARKIADGLPADWPQHLSAAVAPAGRLLAPEEVASAAIYWLSDESRPVSGTVLELEQRPVIGRNPAKET